MSKAHTLFQIVREVYKGAANKLIDPMYYVPSTDTDEVEAAIFVHAWFLSSSQLIERFGQSNIISLFDRFRNFLPICPKIAATDKIFVFRGDSSSPRVPYKEAFSWTTEREPAEQFAWGRPVPYPVLVSAIASCADVLVALPNDEEAEVVVRPGTVHSLSVTSLLSKD